MRDQIDSNNLVYSFKTGVNEPKDFGNYQTPLKLFEDLRDFDINPKEVFFLLSEAKYETKYGEGLKMLTPKQMLQRLSEAFAQVKTGNNLGNSLNENIQIVYSLYHSKEITKKNTIASLNQ